MAAVQDQSMALVSSFLSIGTPTYGCSPRLGMSSPRVNAAGLKWGADAHVPGDDVVGQVLKAAPPSTSVVQLSAPPLLARESKIRSVSTLSLGDGDNLTSMMDLANPVNNALGRFVSEDFMGVFSLPILSSAAANGETPRIGQDWSAVGAIAEDSVFAPPMLVSQKSEDVFPRFDRYDSGLIRRHSEDIANLILASRPPLPSAISSKAVEVAAPSSATVQGDATNSAAHSSSHMHMDVEQQRPASSSSSEDEVDERREPARRVSIRNLGKPKRKIVDDDVDSDEEYMPSSQKSKKHRKSSPSSTSFTSSSKCQNTGYSHNNRGAHVRGRPEMQETARNGQRHWATEVQELRRRWDQANCSEADRAFQPQLELMARRHIKNQHECLLRSLHIAAAEGMVVPHGYNNVEGKSFLGWTGFDIIPDRAGDFRMAIESMFPQPLLENTLHNTFRRAGLVPASWSEAWLGLAPFNYKKPV